MSVWERSSEMVCPPSTVQVHPGQNMTVLCRVEPAFDLTLKTLEWKRGPDVVHMYRSGGDNYDDQDLRFKNRTFLNHQNLKDGIFSLTLTNVDKEDEGTYTLCLPNHDICSNVTLIVRTMFPSFIHLFRQNSNVIFFLILSSFSNQVVTFLI
uniref:Ig-like domain-containing protein n=1 Tax=Oryzias latipes TaxID=8090 RepID=A0A3P9JM90_ORYLA